MLTEAQINALAVKTKILVEKELHRLVLSVYLVGSFAAGTATTDSDVDFLVEFDGGKLYPSWHDIYRINNLLSKDRVHVIFGTREAQEHSKRPFKEINFKEISQCLQASRQSSEQSKSTEKQAVFTKPTTRWV